MKLRNKKTGEICEFMIHKRIEDSKDGNPVYAPFTDSVEDWEDYEEPKEYWVVDYITCGVDNLTIDPKEPEMDDFNKEIGNYFETEEEAEKAVEKLKAWKRLKDCGFKFDGWFDGNTSLMIDTNITLSQLTPRLIKDLDLLFGGEE